MALLPPTIMELAQQGANFEIGKDSNYLAPTVKDIIRTAVANGGHVTLHADNYLPPTLKEFVTLGKGSVTLII